MLISLFDRNKFLLQRVHVGADVHPSEIHWLLAKQLRRVQYRIPQYQAGLSRLGHCVCLDLGCNVGELNCDRSVPDGDPDVVS